MGVPYGTLTAPAYLSLCKPLMLRTALKQLRILSERQKTRIIKSNNINLTNDSFLVVCLLTDCKIDAILRETHHMAAANLALITLFS